MCGIFGIWHLDGRPLDLSTVQRAVTVLRHRGPDDEGYLLVNTQTGRAVLCGGLHTDASLNLPPINAFYGEVFDLALGFRRLAILDLSPAGHQPMTSADRRFWIVYNGEVYNYVELRAELTSYGFEFRTGTDTEVILAAYQQWGPECLSHFNGMWAFAIWDQRERQLFCARDRCGVKPFYYTYDGVRFAFASEIKALFCDPATPVRPNNQHIYDYLVLGYLNHTDETLFEGVLQLGAANYMLLGESGSLRISRYWDLAPEKPSPRPDKEWVAEFRQTLQDAVRLRLRSDVPVGSCLSGGIDSSTIVCTVNQLLSSEIRPDFHTRMGDHQKTFSSIFNYPDIDEKPFIEAVLQQTGAEEHTVTPRGEELMQTAPRLVWHQGEPFGSTTIYAQWHVMQLARSAGITVLLDGQGADELLAGYSHYYSSFWADLIRTGCLTALWREWKSFPYHLELDPYRSLGAALRRLALHLAKRDRLSFVAAAPTWLDPQFAAQCADESPWTRRNPHYASVLDEHLYDSLTRSSLPSLLHYEDHNSMAFSIEARVPYLDYRLIELCYSLPVHLKINKGTTKVILREAARNIVPEMVRTRQGKLGFPTPGDIWLREYIVGDVEQIFRSPSFQKRGYVKPKVALSLLERHRSGATKADKTLWRMVCLELWMQVFFDRSDPTICP